MVYCRGYGVANLKYQLKDLVDIPRLQELTDHFYKTAEIPSAIITTDGEILTESGWQRICTNFHRKHPEMEKDCIASDIAIRKKIDEGAPFAMYTCPRGLTDASVPIIIEGEHIANAFAGQLFLEPPEKVVEMRFRENAREFGLDEEAYIAAYREIPVIPLEKFQSVLLFLSQLAQMIAGLGLQRKRELEGTDRLRESEEFNRSMIENSLDCIKLLDVKGHLLFMSLGGQNLLEIEDLQAYIGKSWIEFWKEEDQVRVSQAVFEAGQGRIGRFQAFCPTAKGKPKWWDVIISPISNLAGNVERLLAVSRDITDRKRAEEALQKSVAHHRTLVETIPDLVWLKDPQGVYLSCNPRFENFFGAKVADILGKTDFDFVDKDLAEFFRDHDRKAMEAGGPSINEEWLTFAETGYHGLFETIKSPMRDAEGTLIGVLGVARDISERKQAEEALRIAEETYRNIFLDSPVGLFRTDIKTGLLLDANDAVARFVGFESREQLLAAPFDIAERYVDTNAREKMISLLKENGSFQDFKARFRRNDGSIILMKYSAKLRPEKGWLEGVSENITERERAEAYGKMANEILQILNEPTDLPVSIQRVLAALKTGTGFDAVGIRLQDGDDFPYFAQEGFSKDFLRTENTLIERGSDGDVCRDKDGNACLECTCGLVISGKTDPANPNFTNGGSCWINDGADTPFHDTRLHSRDRCLHDGFQSVALVPIRNMDRIIGLIQINDQRKGLLSLQVVESLEGIASHIGAALARKRAEEALRRSESQYRLLAENSLDVIWTIDLEGRYTFISPSVVNLSGFTPEEALSLSIDDILVPDDLARTRQFMAEEMQKPLDQQSPSLTLELRHYRKDRSIVDIETTMTWIRDREGLPAGIQGTSRDITERKQTEKALGESEETFRALAENSIDTIMRFDKEHRHLYVNPIVESQTGIQAEDFLGKTHKEMGFPEYLCELWGGAIDKVFKTGKTGRIEFKLPTDLWVDWLCMPEFDENGEVKAVITSARDITDRKRAERALQESEARFRDISESMADWIWEIDAEGTFTYVSENVFSILGYTTQELLGKTPFDFMPPDEARRVAGKFTEIVANKQIIRDLENWNLSKDGKRICLVTNGIPLLDERGELLGYRGIDRDITERKKAEEEKTKLEGKLRQSQKMEAVGRLAGGVAHDFNNILTGINGYAEMIIEGLDADDSLRPNMEVILSSGKRAADLTAQLLAFSRKQIIAPRVIAPNDILIESQKMLRRIIAEDIDFVFAPGNRLWRILADPTQLDQVLMNLAVNARDAMPNGGKLTIETQNVSLDDEYCKSHAGFKPGDYVMLAVTDTGHGMDEETKSKIFEPFFSTKEVGKGTGLGLAMVYGVMKQNKGFINVYSEIGEGTTFKIYFPALKEKAEKPATDKIADMPAGTETVLLVEDEGIVRNLAKTVLERQGYTVIVAPDGEKAYLEYTQYAGKIDLLLTDVIMPKMNGGELYKKLLDLKPGLKALFMSGYTEDAIAHHGVLDKGTHFLQKPFTIQALAKAVRKALDS
jgi:two-component system, cell cycle sensor histidine kinase and response regulator CckA